MGQLWPYKQNPNHPDPEIDAGVCMAMSYYVAKRMLASCMTTPDVLERKMGLFASMQRAFDNRPEEFLPVTCQAPRQRDAVSSLEWVKMLAHHDNLQTVVLGYFDEDIGEVMERAFEAVKNTPEEEAAVYLSVKWAGAGHGIAAFSDGSASRTIFDPNLGMYQIEHEMDQAMWEVKFEDEYAKFGKIVRVGAVLIYGEPRDLKSLNQDFWA